jgi:hypothetical protein
VGKGNVIDLIEMAFLHQRCCHFIFEAIIPVNKSNEFPTSSSTTVLAVQVHRINHLWLQIVVQSSDAYKQFMFFPIL